MDPEASLTDLLEEAGFDGMESRFELDPRESGCGAGAPPRVQDVPSVDPQVAAIGRIQTEGVHARPLDVPPPVPTNAHPHPGAQDRVEVRGVLEMGARRRRRDRPTFPRPLEQEVGSPESRLISDEKQSCEEDRGSGEDTDAFEGAHHRSVGAAISVPSRRSEVFGTVMSLSILRPSLAHDFAASASWRSWWRPADGYPGIRGIGPKTAAQLLNRYGPFEAFPPDVLPEERELALRFKELATLRTDEPLFGDVDELRWSGPTADFASWVDRLEDPKLLQRSLRAPTD